MTQNCPFIYLLYSVPVRFFYCRSVWPNLLLFWWDTILSASLSVSEPRGKLWQQSVEATGLSGLGFNGAFHTFFQTQRYQGKF